MGRASRFRQAIAAKTARTYPGWSPDPETDITVVCGATEGMIASMLGLLDPGDEVVVFEPFYENYGPDAILSGAVPRYVTLHEPDWSIDPDELRAAFGPRTRGDRRQLAPQPDRQGVLARRAGADRRPVPASTTCSRSPTTSTSTSSTRGAHPAGHAARHGRAHGLDQLDVEDVLGDGLAGRLGDRGARR